MTESSAVYADNNGCNCPVCDSEALDTPKAPQVYGIHIKHYVQCKDCGSNWVDVYKLDGYEQLEEQG
jgi:transposase-like protein